MRIATTQFYDRPSLMMASLNARADTLQTQIATGKRFTTASEDPSAWLRVDTLNRADSNDAAYAQNVKLAQGVLAQSDSTLSSIETRLQRAQELAVEAGNGALSDENRQAIKAELDAIVEDLYNLANTKDLRGQSLFSGASDGAAYTRAADGTISYAGTGEPPAIPVGDGSTVNPTVSGERAFGDMFSSLGALSDALGSGGSVGDASDSIAGALDRIAAARSSVGARAARMDLEEQRLTDTATARADVRSAIEETDISATITELQKTLTILQATQASFTKLSGLSLFDYLR